MSTIAAERAAFEREPIFLLELHMDYCSKQNPAIGSGGGNECSASTACRYTWFTCQDTASFTKTTRVFKFCNRGARPKTGTGLQVGARPLMHPPKLLPTVINPEKFKTEVGELKVFMEDDAVPHFSDPDKIAGDYSQTDSGRWWANWQVRYQNYEGRIAKLYMGYKGVDVNDYELVFLGIIHDVDWAKAGINITIRDMLWKSGDKKFPAKIPSSVFVEDNPLGSGDLTVNLNDSSGVYDATDHFEAATAEQPRVAKIENEYILYTGITVSSDGSALTGCTRGAFGTTPAEHVYGTTVTQATIYANDDAGTWAGCTGVGADHCLLDLLCFYAEVPHDYIALHNPSITLDGAISDSDDTITLSSTGGLSEHGIIKIEDEFIEYYAIDSDGVTVTSCDRGMFTTTAAAHADTTAVYQPEISYTLGDWRPDLLMKARFEAEASVRERIETWRRSALVNVWTNEDGEITAGLQAPPLDTSYEDLDADDIIFDSKSVLGKTQLRITRVYAWYDPINADPAIDGKDAEGDYNYMRGYVDRVAEGTNAYDAVKIKTLYCEWLYRAADAQWTAAHYYVKFRESMHHVRAALELRKDTIKVGSLVRMTVKEIVDSDGTLVAKFYYVLSKARTALGRLDMLFERAGFGDDNYARIGPLNGVLDVGIDNSETVIYVDLSGTSLTASDWRTGGTHHIYIEDEKISYTTAVDMGSNILKLSGGARGVDSTTPVAHEGDSSAAAGVDVRMLYSAASDECRRRYGFIGSTGDPPAGNKLDADGDFSEETAGYLAY